MRRPAGRLKVLLPLTLIPLAICVHLSCKARGGASGASASLLSEEPARAAEGEGFTRVALSADDIEALWGTISVLEPEESKTLQLAVGSATCANHGLGEGVRVLCTLDLQNAGPKSPMSAVEVERFCEKIYGRDLNLEGGAIFKVTSECWLAGTVDHLEFIAGRYDLLELEEKLGAHKNRGGWVVGIDLFERRAVRPWNSAKITDADFDSLKSSALVYYPERYYRDRSWDMGKARPLVKDLGSAEFKRWFLDRFVRDIPAAEDGDRKARDAKAVDVLNHLSPFLFTGPGSTVTIVPLSNPGDENAEFTFFYVIGDKVVASVVTQFSL